MYKMMKYLLSALMTMFALGCTGTDDITPDASLTFSVGDRVGATTKQQFISIVCGGAWSLEIEYADEEQNDWCTLTPTSGQGNANVMMVFGENKGEQERTLTIVAHLDNTTITIPFCQTSKFSTTDNSQLAGWYELPEFADDRNRYYFTKHMLPSSGYTKRSFSALYDAQNNIPVWVAYPLCKSYMEGSTRTNNWGPKDPNIPEDKQPDMGRSYNGHYDRGHMLPSASRDNNAADNNQTYYPSNVTPQLDDLNQRKWVSVEELVRTWAEGCDTLYVVTGAVLQTVDGDEHINYTYARNSYSMDVAIPNYYYKALLQYNDVDGTKTYQALAIWMEHKAASGNVTTNDIITIDELERRVGYDLFANIDSNVQNQIESSYNLAYWKGVE